MSGTFSWIETRDISKTLRFTHSLSFVSLWTDGTLKRENQASENRLKLLISACSFARCGLLQENRSLRGFLVFLQHLVLQEILEAPARKVRELLSEQFGYNREQSFSFKIIAQSSKPFLNICSIDTTGLLNLGIKWLSHAFCSLKTDASLSLSKALKCLIASAGFYVPSFSANSSSQVCQSSQQTIKSLTMGPAGPLGPDCPSFPGGPWKHKIKTEQQN